MVDRSAGGNEENTRDRIMAAAELLALERGPAHVSVEAVARNAGLSKGGVLYHFPTKADLLVALIERHIESTRARIERCESDQPRQSNRLIAALLTAYLEERSEPSPPTGGVLVAIAENPSFLDSLRHFQAEIAHRLKAESSDPELALIAYMALEGLKLRRLLGASQLDVADENRMLRRLAQMIGGETAA